MSASASRRGFRSRPGKQVQANSSCCRWKLASGLRAFPNLPTGDIFLDLEGDPFVGEHGLEYLFGYLFKDRERRLAYQSDWAFTRADEKQAFENVRRFRHGAVGELSRTCTSITTRLTSRRR